MKRFRFPGLLDVVVSKDAAEIKNLAGNPLLDRAYTHRSLLLNRYILQRVRKVLQVAGRPFPTVAERSAPGRAAAQDALWSRLQAEAKRLATGPEELEDLALFVRGESSAASCGTLVQNVVGRLFAPEFKATAASWAAALVLDKAPRTINPALLAWWAATKRVDRAKQLLSGMVGGDLAGVHAVGIALHNIVSGVARMQQIFHDRSQGDVLTAEAAGARCLFAPGSVLRQPTDTVTSAAENLTPETLVLLKLQDANAPAPSGDIVFLRESWSRCPAEQWVPALLEGIWRRACRHPEGDGSASAQSCLFPAPEPSR